MTSKEILEKIKSLTNQEKRNISYDELIEIMSYNNALERDNRKRKTLLHKKHHHK